MNKYLIVLLLISFPALSEIVVATGKHKHLGKNYTTEQSCNIAEEKAKKNAMVKSLGQKISSDVITKCSEIDGEYNCERNQFSLLQLNGDISWKVINKHDDKELGSEIYFCEVKIEADVKPIKVNQDPTFQFNVKINQEIFRHDEVIELNISTSKRMYMAIFQWLPYIDKKNDPITKIFPNEKFNKNTNDLIEKNLKLKYKVLFPDKVKLNTINEYFVFIASEEPIPWLDSYVEIESLKKQLNKSNILMEKKIKDYIIIR